MSKECFFGEAIILVHKRYMLTNSNKSIYFLAFIFFIKR
ncbi:hypothetical protein BANRA_02822 [Escherichia coli]|uniref:Uncharacterized protein n=1 Tax=Escherichia coli TaxID=562 RepID=A0A3P5DR41_ECOLX|nr:hypothetical protein BANRA_02822 [Escherichia coli]